MSAVQVRDLSFTYRDMPEPALRGINLNLDAGEWLMLMGEAGAGKSTLCKCVNGLIPKFQKGEFSGSVRAAGRETLEHPVREMARSVGIVFQDFEAQLFSTRVDLEIAFALENFGLPHNQMRERIGRMLALVGLQGFEKRAPAALSGGEKQRLAIASALAPGPPIVVMDEPTSDLDPVGRKQVLGIAHRLRQEKPTMIMVEHDAETALQADRVAIMSKGRLVRQGGPAGVLSDSNFLQQNGIAPLQTMQLVSALGIQEMALTPEHAHMMLRARGIRPDTQAFERIRQQNNERVRNYGEVTIEVKGLVHRYQPGNPAVAGVNLTVRRGEFIAILGANGSGKTTLAQHLNRLLEPSEGQVRVEGEDTRKQSLLNLAHKVGYIFQNPDHQLFAATVADEVAFGPRNFGLAESEVQARVAAALAAVNMAHARDHDPFTLTKGERQRVAVASILAARPEVLVFDEPTTGLDYRQTRTMMELVSSLNRAGHTMIIITHNMSVAAEYAHRVIVMQAGNIIADGPTREVFAREDLLAQAGLAPPPIARLGNMMGCCFLSLEEAIACLH